MPSFVLGPGNNKIQCCPEGVLNLVKNIEDEKEIEIVLQVLQGNKCRVSQNRERAPTSDGCVEETSRFHDMTDVCRASWALARTLVAFCNHPS